MVTVSNQNDLPRNQLNRFIYILSRVVFGVGTQLEFISAPTNMTNNYDVIFFFFYNEIYL